MFAISIIFLYFIVYSFIGWFCETLYCSFFERKFVNRGFLNGPLCPIYGFGGLAVIYLLSPFKNNIILLFIAGMIVTTSLEYFTSFLLEKLFHMKWWDYHAYKFNINGRVCLLNAIEFGVLSVVAVEILHPIITSFIGSNHTAVILCISALLFTVLIVDIVITIRTITQLNGKLRQLEQLIKELKKTKESYKKLAKYSFSNSIEHIKELESEQLSEAKAYIERLKLNRDLLENKHKPQLRRLLLAFPDMISLKHQPTLNRIKKLLKSRNRNS